MSQQTAPAVAPPDGECVCGRRLPDGSPSDWACSEVCQSAWLHHNADPDYPHPRDIRAAAEQRAAQNRRLSPAGPTSATIADGTEIGAACNPYVRVGACWQPAGMWTPQGVTSTYRRWCPQCRTRTETLLLIGPPGDRDRQRCDQCEQVWPGRPLVGVVETRSDPWPALRLRLSDGHLSVSAAFSMEESAQIFGDHPTMADRVGRCWLRLERQLCGGYADQDQPDQRQQQRQARRLARVWRWHTDPGTQT